MMLKAGSFKIAELAGIEFRLHWSFPVLALFVALSSGPIGLLMMLAVFGFVALHELGHCLAARHFRIPVDGVTLWPLGGVAQIGGMIGRPKTEFWVTAAGPAVNFALAALLTPFAYLAFTFYGVTLVNWLVGVNLVLGLFNLLPAFPMDGGRILRAYLATRYNNHLLATERAVTVGQVVAVLMALAGLFFDPTLILLAAFIYYLGQQELALARQVSHSPRMPRRVDQIYQELIKGFNPGDRRSW